MNHTDMELLPDCTCPDGSVRRLRLSMLIMQTYCLRLEHATTVCTRLTNELAKSIQPPQPECQ